MDGDLIPKDDDARKQWLARTAMEAEAEAEAMKQLIRHLAEAQRLATLLGGAAGAEVRDLLLRVAVALIDD